MFLCRCFFSLVLAGKLSLTLLTLSWWLTCSLLLIFGQVVFLGLLLFLEFACGF